MRFTVHGTDGLHNGIDSGIGHAAEKSGAVLQEFADHLVEVHFPLRQAGQKAPAQNLTRIL